MFKRFTKFVVLAVTLGIILSIFSAPAQAEQCSPDGKICLVEEFTEANPLATGGTFHLKVPAEVSQVGINPPSYPHVINQGPPGGTSLWEGTLQPGAVNQDGPLSIAVQAFGSELSATATFQVPVLAAATNFKATIRRTKTRVFAYYEFDARTAVTATIRLHLNSFDSEEIILRYRKTTKTVGPEPGQVSTHHVIRVALSRNLINRKCASHGACSVLAGGESRVGDLDIDQSADRKKLTLHRAKLRHKKPKKHTTKHHQKQ